jgi:SAM-dependent methyltransferase
MVSSLLHWLDRYFGRGSYYWLRDHLYPQREYTQLTYARLIDDRLAPHTRWLDAGGGHQILEVPSPDMELAMVQRAKLAVCCEIDRQALKQHRSIRNRVAASLDNLPFQARGFDLVTLNNVAEHLEHPVKVLSEIARVMAPDGTVIIHTPNVQSYPMWLVRIGRRIFPKRAVTAMIRYLDFREEEDVFPTYYRANTDRQLTAAAAEAGLSCVQVLLLPARPLFYFIAPLCAIELLASRALMWLGARRFAASVIVAVYCRKSAP